MAAAVAFAIVAPIDQKWRPDFDIRIIARLARNRISSGECGIKPPYHAPACS
jgi:hypothetical protein